MKRAALRKYVAAAVGAFAATLASVIPFAPVSAQEGAAPPARGIGPMPPTHGIGLGPGAQGGQGRGGFVAYPPREPGNPAAIERGKTLWGVNCTFCHGPDARGGDGGGPNLLRSSAMLDDQGGELIGPIVQKGRGAMPATPLSNEQVADIAAFLHSIPVSSRTGPSTLDIVVGDVKRGEAYVGRTCVKCHTIAALRTFAGKLDDPRTLQQMWMMPGSGGRGFAPSTAPVPRPPITALVTMPSGERLEGRVEYIDDFTVTLLLAEDQRRTIATFGTAARVELRDPLQPHKELLPIYADSDIHDVTAYLVSLRKSQ
jgi:mono/diheme cytochrome c family protein